MHHQLVSYNVQTFAEEISKIKYDTVMSKYIISKEQKYYITAQTNANDCSHVNPLITVYQCMPWLLDYNLNYFSNFITFCQLSDIYMAFLSTKNY